MRRALFLALLAVCAAAPGEAAEPIRERLSRYFSSWYSVCPSTRVTVTPVPELALAGYEAYRVERQCALKNRNNMSVTLVDAAGTEVFVGEVLHDDTRKGRPFSATQDLPVLKSVLSEAYGVPVSIEVQPGARGPLKPIRVSLRQAQDASASLPGFVSENGASLLIGEFRPLDVDPTQLRRRMLAESPGVRPRPGAYFVTAFIDFQCEKCRQRTPELSDFAWAHGGGALEFRFLPMVKVHDWAFSAAETAAALANVSAPLYARYEEAVFPQASAMTPAGARQVGEDLAEAAGVGAAFRAELSSGRARQRVVKDVELAMRLGLNGTPVFFYEGAQLTSETGVAEGYIESRLNGAPKASSGNGPR